MANVLLAGEIIIYRINHNLFVFLLYHREAEIQQEELTPKEIQRWCAGELKQNIRPDILDSIEDWKTGVGFNCKIFCSSRGKNVLWALSLEAINEGEGAGDSTWPVGTREIPNQPNLPAQEQGKSAAQGPTGTACRCPMLFHQSRTWINVKDRSEIGFF